MGKEGDKDGLEIERRFLLAKMPNLGRQKDVKDYYILQTYIQTDNPNQIYRLRWEVDRNSSRKASVTCYRTTKEEVSVGISKEVESVIRTEEYLKEIRDAVKNKKIIGSIAKDRIKVSTKQGVWEIDKFRDLNLIIAEIELPSLDALKRIPSFIKKVNVLEITGVKELSNYSLSKIQNNRYQVL